MSLVTVVVPAFNAASFLEATVASVRAQSHSDWEMVLVDDGSNDGTWNLIQRLVRQDDRIRGVLQPNGGVSNARNTGIARTNSNWVALLDADDVWAPAKLERQLEIADRRSADVVCCNAAPFCEDQPPPEWRLPTEEVLLEGESGIRRLIHHNMVVLSSTLIRRSWLHQTGGFDERFPMCEDYQLWLRMLVAGARIVYSPERLVQYRIHSNPTNLSSSRMEMKRHRMLALRDLKLTTWGLRWRRWLKRTELSVSLARHGLARKFQRPSSMPSPQAGSHATANIVSKAAARP